MERPPALTEERPWGGFRVLTKNEKSTVKILFIKKGEIFSLQKHAHRDEFWRVLSGTPEISIDSKTVNAKAGDEFEVTREMSHRVSAPNDDVEILEISTGEFDESDIIRLEDKYGRA